MVSLYLLLEETFVQVQALRQRVPGPSLSQDQMLSHEASAVTARGHQWFGGRSPSVTGYPGGRCGAAFAQGGPGAKGRGVFWPQALPGQN